MNIGGSTVAAALTVVALSACSSRSETTTPPPPPDLARPTICPGYTPPAQPGKPCRADSDCAATEWCTAGGTYNPPPSPV